MQEVADTVISFSTFLSDGGAAAIFGLLLFGIGGLVLERNRLIKRSQDIENKIIESKNKEIETVRQIIDKYHEGNLNLSTTLSEIKLVLQSIQNTRR